MTKKMDMFIVRENEWLHSKGINGSLLLNEKRCCLGFYSQQLLEYTDEDMHNTAYPSRVSSVDTPSWLTKKFLRSDLFEGYPEQMFGPKALEEHIGDVNDLLYRPGSNPDTNVLFKYLADAGLTVSEEVFMQWKRKTITYLFRKYGNVKVVFEQEG